jgi:membrane protease YdiL (CAAX protease family)
VLRVELLAMAFLAAVPSLVFALRGFSDPTDVDLEVPALELVAALLAALGPAAMALYLLWRDGQLGAAGFDRRPLGFVVGYGALGWVCCFIALITVAVVVNAVILATGGEVDEATESFDLTAGTFLAILALSITAGLGEEIVFRAYAITRMTEAGFGTAAVWLPWAVFTALHLYQGPTALFVIGAVGAVFVWLYLWRRSVWPVILAHTLYDVTILLVTAAA